MRAQRAVVRSRKQHAGNQRRRGDQRGAAAGAGRAKDALAAFEAVTKKEPNRFLALFGAGKAAEAAKQPAKAKGYYREIVKICADAAPDRPELVYARKMAK